MARWKASLYVVIGATCYGMLSTFVKIILQKGFTIQEISTSAILFGCLMLWIITLPALREIKKYSWKTISIVTFVGTAWGFTEIFYMLTLNEIPASLAVVLLFQFTWMTQIVHMIQTKSWLTLDRWIALGFILLGTYLASGADITLLLQMNTLGVIFGLLSAVSYTASIYVSGAVSPDMNPSLRSALMLTGQMIFVLLVFKPPSIQALSEGLWMWAGFLGLIGFVVTTYAFNRGVPHIGTSLAGVLGSIELPMVILLSSIVLLESVTPFQWMGVVAILVGIVLTEYGGRIGRLKNTK